MGQPILHPIRQSYINARVRYAELISQLTAIMGEPPEKEGALRKYIKREMEVRKQLGIDQARIDLQKAERGLCSYGILEPHLQPETEPKPEPEPPKERRNYYVYTLAYPKSMGGKVFYVGKGTGIRFDFHVSEARQMKLKPNRRASNREKCEAIMSILDRGEEVDLNFVGDDLTEEEALHKERQLIIHYGMDALTNGNSSYEGRWRGNKTPIDGSRRIMHVGLTLSRNLIERLKQCMIIDGINPNYENVFDYVRCFAFDGLYAHLNTVLDEKEGEKENTPHHEKP